MSLKNISDLFTVAFYNLENLFDTTHDEYTLDKDFTPKGEMQWDEGKYTTKIHNLSKAIVQIGNHKSVLPPIFLGVAEVENRKVLEDLVASDHLKAYDYDFVHYDSPDERGIDVAFLYQKKYFELTYSDTYTLMLEDKNHDRDYTRDILLISGKLFGNSVHIIINHWPSRNKGKRFSENKRIRAAGLIHKIVNEIKEEDADPNIMIMGDFNDDPNSNSIRKILEHSDFFNPMSDLHRQGKGSLYHQGKWHLFDQIILSNSFNSKKGLLFKNAEVINEYFLQEKYGRSKGAPLRTFSGGRYVGGYSDHFPVCAYFEKTD
ncbi:MAG: endonuclease [Flavobacteriia bacterium]|nr:MAG: endonuclease [Flavobacteriia bacterium]